MPLSFKSNQRGVEMHSVQEAKIFLQRQTPVWPHPASTTRMTALVEKVDISAMAFSRALYISLSTYLRTEEIAEGSSGMETSLVWDFSLWSTGQINQL